MERRKRNQNKTLKGIFCKSPKSFLVACLRMSCYIPAYGAEMVYEREPGRASFPLCHHRHRRASIPFFPRLPANKSCPSLCGQINSERSCQVANAEPYLLFGMSGDGADAPRPPKTPLPQPLVFLTSPDMWTHIVSASSGSWVGKRGGRGAPARATCL